MYDAIVVGARCAGSSIAMLLARKGYRVLLLDRDSFPSDMSMSTHLVHQRARRVIPRWCTRWVDIDISLGKLSRSRSSTRYPFRAKSIAIELPAHLAPTTIASYIVALLVATQAGDA